MQDSSTVRVTDDDVVVHRPRTRTLPFAANGLRALRGAEAR